MLVAATLAAQIAARAAEDGWTRVDHVAVAPSTVEESALDVYVGIKANDWSAEVPTFAWVYSCRVPVTADGATFLDNLAVNLAAGAASAGVALS